MSDTPEVTRDAPSTVDATGVPPRDDTGFSASSASEIDDVIQVLEERLTVGTRRKVTGSVTVGTRTEIVEAVAEAELDRYRVEVTRVPVGRVIDEAPLARAEGDVTIVPVVEERLVVVKQLFLVEEVHIRHVLDRKVVSEPVALRRQRVVVERRDAEGQAIKAEAPPDSD